MFEMIAIVNGKSHIYTNASLFSLARLYRIGVKHGTIKPEGAIITEYDRIVKLSHESVMNLAQNIKDE